MTPSLPLGFWGGWVLVLTLVSLLGLAWVIYSSYFGGKGTASEEESSTVWDGNLREGAHAPPMWWFWMMLASLCFTLVYLILYPGFGGFAGAFDWSQGGELEERLAKYEVEFGESRTSIVELDIDTLQQNSELMDVAGRVFARHCAACHGQDATGQVDRFPNLRDDLWQWGGSATEIEQSIRDGRHGIMVGWNQALNRTEASYLTKYVLALAGSQPASHPGKAKYEELCVACHGMDGTGNTALGAPDLTKGLYTYGHGALSVKSTILYGREGVMPAFGTVLDETQIRLLVAWLSIPEPI